MKMKLSEVAKELPYRFKWKDHWYILNGERYFRVDDDWEPYFYLYQLDEEVETSSQELEEGK